MHSTSSDVFPQLHDECVPAPFPTIKASVTQMLTRPITALSMDSQGRQVALWQDPERSLETIKAMEVP